MLAEITLGTIAATGGITLVVSVTFSVLLGLILWPKIANAKIRELIPDDAEAIVDGVSSRVRSGVNSVTLPEDDELRFYWHLQKARDLSEGQDEVLTGLETARTKFTATK